MSSPPVSTVRHRGPKTRVTDAQLKFQPQCQAVPDALKPTFLLLSLFSFFLYKNPSDLPHFILHMYIWKKCD